MLEEPSEARALWARAGVGARLGRGPSWPSSRHSRSLFPSPIHSSTLSSITVSLHHPPCTAPRAQADPRTLPLPPPPPRAYPDVRRRRSHPCARHHPPGRGGHHHHHPRHRRADPGRRARPRVVRAHHGRRRRRAPRRRHHAAAQEAPAVRRPQQDLPPQGEHGEQLFPRRLARPPSSFPLPRSPTPQAARARPHGARVRLPAPSPPRVKLARRWRVALGHGRVELELRGPRVTRRGLSRATRSARVAQQCRAGLRACGTSDPFVGAHGQLELAQPGCVRAASSSLSPSLSEHRLVEVSSPRAGAGADEQHPPSLRRSRIADSLVISLLQSNPTSPTAETADPIKEAPASAPVVDETGAFALSCSPCQFSDSR